MATFTASAAQSDAQPKSLRVGLSGVSAQYDSTGVSLSIGTVFNMLKIPAGARVLFMSYGTTTGAASPTIQIGDSVNAMRYASANTLSAGQGMVMASTLNQNYSYSADDVIVMRVSLASGSSLGGVFILNAIWGMDAGGAGFLP
jgi:hypothetical protein